MVLAQLAVDESAGYEPLIVILPVTMMKTQRVTRQRF